MPEPDASGADGGCNQADIEANDTPATSRPLAATTDCDDKGNKNPPARSPPQRMSIGSSFHGSDTRTCVVNPTATVSETGLRLCVYVKCDSGQGSVPTCAQGTKDSSPPSGLDGCCATTPGSVEASVSCPGTDESTTVMMRVAASSPAPLTCKWLHYHLPLLVGLRPSASRASPRCDLSGVIRLRRTAPQTAPISRLGLAGCDLSGVIRLRRTAPQMRRFHAGVSVGCDLSGVIRLRRYGAAEVPIFSLGWKGVRIHETACAAHVRSARSAAFCLGGSLR